MAKKESVTLKEILAKNGLDGKMARRKLRKHFTDHGRGEPWTFVKDSKDHKKVLSLLKIKTA